MEWPLLAPEAAVRLPSRRSHSSVHSFAPHALDLKSRGMKDEGADPPAIGFGKEIILGREFDSDKPEEYLESIRKL